MRTKASKVAHKPATGAKRGRKPKLRSMHSYTPRRSTRSMNLGRQELSDLEHKISADIGAFLVLLEQGNAEQILLASQKARSDFLKLAPDMKKLAMELGGVFPHFVDTFLHSIDNIIHTGVNWLDDAKIQECYTATRALEEILKTRISKKSA